MTILRRTLSLAPFTAVIKVAFMKEATEAGVQSVAGRVVYTEMRSVGHISTCPPFFHDRPCMRRDRSMEHMDVKRRYLAYQTRPALDPKASLAKTPFAQPRV